MSTVRATPVQRALALIFALQGHSFEGLRLRQVSQLVGQREDKTLRDLEALAEEGITERLPANKDRWRLTPRLVQLAIAHQDEIDRLRQRNRDFEQTYACKP
ncbi:hypothetical protein ACNQFN_11400 [Thauera butanivorans]|uniref:hypothetical protein n=1 Tax=Thauera butanivorans TaxID=86174 RepID=UPI003AB4AB33